MIKIRLIKSLLLFFMTVVFLVFNGGVAKAALNQDDLNSIIEGTQFYKADSGLCAATATPLSGSDNAAQVYNYLIAKGLTSVQAAGVMGNLQAESGFNPQRVQSTQTPAGDKPEITVDGVTGYGIAQWTDKGRQQNLLNFATDAGKSSGDLGLQLDFLYMESTTGSRQGAWQKQATQTDVTQATYAWEDNYENPASKHEQNRVDFANAVLARASEFASTTPATPATPSNGQTIIALDPGHSPNTDPAAQDPTTGLFTYDYENDPEMADAYTAATKIKPLLEAKGYQVVITKSSATEKLDLSQRALRANATGAALLFTMHSNIDGGSGTFYLGYPDENSVRIPGTSNDPAQRKDGKTGLVHPEIMAASKADAEKIAPIIAQQIGEAGYTAKSFNTIYGANGLLGNGKNYGNTPVQTILSSIPEVYSEVRRDILPTDTFAQAAADAISQTVPPTGANTPGSAASTGCPQSGGSVAQVAQQEYAAWQAGDDAYKQQARAKYRDSSDGSPGGEAWCADFVSWVYMTAGTPLSGGGSGGWRVASAYLPILANNITWTAKSENKFPPQPGDFIFVHYDSGTGGGSIDGKLVTHVGLIISIDGSKITTIEGNVGSSNILSLSYTDYNSNGNGEIVGWGRVQ